MTHVECPYCDQAGLVRSERIFKGGSALTSYSCAGCTRAWEVADDTPNGTTAEILTPPRQAKTARASSDQEPS